MYYTSTSIEGCALSSGGGGEKAWEIFEPFTPVNELVACSKVEQKYNYITCALSSVGRAVRLHRKGREFKSLSAHNVKCRQLLLAAFCV